MGLTPVARSLHRLGSALALALALSACSAGADPAPGASAASAPRAGDASGALAFSGPTLAGGELDVATLAGSPVVLWFWAPWCTICRAEAPDVAQVAAEFDGRVTVLGVPGRGQAEAMRSFVADTGTGGLTHVVDADGAIWNRFGVFSQPAFVFVDRAGEARVFAGSLGAEDLRAALAELAA